jgi:hypothetical protein
LSSIKETHKKEENIILGSLVKHIYGDNKVCIVTAILASGIIEVFMLEEPQLFTKHRIHKTQLRLWNGEVTISN